MDDQENDSTNEVIDTFCVGCDLPFPVNDLGLCDDCAAKLDRDLIRSRDWEYSVTAFAVAPDQLETLRERVIRDYGAAYELIESPKKPKNKRSKSRASLRKRAIAAQAIRDYSTDDVLQTARDFIRTQNEEWVNFSRVSQYLYETFYHLKPKRLGQPSKKYKSLLKLLADYPLDFELRQDPDNRGLYWIRLKMS
ncbi:hypothetical protein FBR06_09225 [Betaproteobacteria bacterium PRO4]|jgi:hypothetical protein|nr:hypothetical protein [Betaproteobacteria bacterium PRO4]